MWPPTTVEPTPPPIADLVIVPPGVEPGVFVSRPVASEFMPPPGWAKPSQERPKRRRKRRRKTIEPPPKSVFIVAGALLAIPAAMLVHWILSALGIGAIVID